MRPHAYVTTFCNRAHRVKDGKPIQHECRVIPPKAIEYEMAGDYSQAMEVLRTTPVRIMRRGVKS